MAPSAAPSIKQSYSAGNCRLDLILQPSALSQWHPQLIVEQVEFKLWMSEGQGAELALLAEGDRSTLQAIAHYIEHRTQAALTVNRTSSTVTPVLPQLPNATQLPHPLSYLQLCDLSTVFTQCGQAAKTLPVSLPAALGTASETVRPIAARSQESNPKGKLIFFPTGRRVAWASSAAAALFAVGLTTTLWNNKTFVPETASISGADLAEPNIGTSENKRLRLGKPADEDLSAALPNGTGRSERNRTQTAQTPDSTTQRAAKPTDVPKQSHSSTNRFSRNNSSATSPSAANSPAGSAASGSAASGSAASPKNPAARESADASADTRIATAPDPTSRQTPDNTPDRKTTSAEPDADALNQAALSVPTDESELPALAAPNPQASARRGQGDRVNRSSAILSPTVAEEAAPSLAVLSRQESETITQVQNYFINQWRPDKNLPASLSYQLQLSPLGEVISFSALTEGGDAYRDRLLPDNTLSFPPANSAALANGLTLKITLTPQGQVQVEKM